MLLSQTVIDCYLVFSVLLGFPHIVFVAEWCRFYGQSKYIVIKWRKNPFKFLLTEHISDLEFKT